MIGRLLLEWRTKQALEYEKNNRQYTNKEMFQDDQMIYLLASWNMVTVALSKLLFSEVRG